MLIPALLDQATTTSVHLLTYSAPVAKKMLHFGRLKYYALPSLPQNHEVPQQLINELGVFAGRLYMEYDECTTLAQSIENDGRSEAAVAATASFLLEWLCLRRKGQDITHTPMGYLCQGRPLNSDHAFFVTQHMAGEHHNGSVDLKRTKAVEVEANEDDVDGEHGQDTDEDMDEDMDVDMDEDLNDDMDLDVDKNTDEE